ncbi:MAG: Holliday junction resolvase RuvX [Vampirovibrionales bacterium]
MSTYIGMDYGKKRIGVAYCDDSETFCFGLPTLARTKVPLAETLQQVFALIDAKNAVALVMGLPRNMDGSEGFMADAVYDFADALLEKRPELPIYLLDERLTSKIAEQHIRESGKAPSRHKGLIDEEAARGILTDFLKTPPERRNLYSPI